ncbi:hypothetical protein HDU81_005227 [Chytriomyces hyalinus]|nr:hypothetical protein HDU81_005227 [Chytriomyces hyalinus]
MPLDHTQTRVDKHFLETGYNYNVRLAKLVFAAIDALECVDRIWVARPKLFHAMANLIVYLGHQQFVVTYTQALQSTDMSSPNRLPCDGCDYCGDVDFLTGTAEQRRYTQMPKATWYSFRGQRWTSDLQEFRKTLFCINTISPQILEARRFYHHFPTISRTRLDQIDRLSQSILKHRCFETICFHFAGEVMVRSQLQRPLDENWNRLGFSNGVYDLARSEFRNGRPEDMLSFSHGYPLDIKVNTHTRASILKFLEEVIADASMRETLMLTLGSMLSQEPKPTNPKKAYVLGWGLTSAELRPLPYMRVGQCGSPLLPFVVHRPGKRVTFAEKFPLRQPVDSTFLKVAGGSSHLIISSRAPLDGNMDETGISSIPLSVCVDAIHST